MDRLLPFLCRVIPEGLEALADLALDTRWTWNHDSDQVWQSIDPHAWEVTLNPWWILQSISGERIGRLADNEQFKKELQNLLKVRQAYLKQLTWMRRTYPEGALKTVAYFSMEFGLGEALPFYAGGLGVLAGDYLKTASDLGVPLVGIGLLFQEGYFRQILDADGRQLAAYPHNDPTNLPLRPAIDAAGGWLQVPLELPGRTLTLRVWQAQVGRIMLYLLDSNVPTNNPADRSLIYKLYDNKPEFRLVQEMALGIGGWRVLKALGLHVEVCHLNEGHTAFVILERIRDFMEEAKQPFPVALWAMRSGNVFTTHTPVAAGYDSFDPELISHFLRGYCDLVGISTEQLLALGRQEHADKTAPFNMGALALRGCSAVNAVSRLHARVSRTICQPLFLRWPEREVPVTHITNGVHMPSWDSQWSDTLWTEAGGKGCWYNTMDLLPEAIQNQPDVELWAMRTAQREALVKYVRQRLARRLRQYMATPFQIGQAENVLDPNVLTLGFARRFAAYKRPNLLLHQPERLAGMLTNREHPVQLVVAGKAHPKDEEGKRLVHQFVTFARREDVRLRVVFLTDYDMGIAQQMVQGVDVWINTPRRPWEACGTSGMKTLVNGGLNLSELDGWWAEAYTPEVGWALGDRQEHTDPGWDAVEAEHLFQILEKQVIPEFYDRDLRGIPTRWVRRIRASMSELTPRFSSNRMLREYVEKIYLPASSRFRERATQHGRLAAELLSWQKALEQHWSKLRFGRPQVKKDSNKWVYEVPVYLGELSPEFISVELYADPSEGDEVVRHPLERGEKLAGSVNGYAYKGAVPATRPAGDYTLRVVPAHPGARVPLEENHILWQR